MNYRSIGNLRVSSLGLGCMGMSEYYGSPNKNESIETIHHALDLGINFFDTADQYGLGKNEELVGQALINIRKQVHIATKFGFIRSPNGNVIKINGNPKYIKAACEASLKRLKTDYIDLYYLHRVDPTIPIEETVGAMKDLVIEGKVREIGLSEVSPQNIQRAYKIHPIAALQSEYSIWSREIEIEILKACRNLNIAIVPYSPLGRGFLSGKIKSIDSLDLTDYRRTTPRFQDDNLKHNLLMLEKLENIAFKLNITVSQLALAWLLSKGKDIIPIPGTKRLNYLNENIASTQIELTEGIKQLIDEIAPIGSTAGDRYPTEAMKLLE
jgi:aryl-alcohol dehydrogenase-like predicted oxidoreductase